jgi:hypothetical protein
VRREQSVPEREHLVKADELAPTLRLDRRWEAVALLPHSQRRDINAEKTRRLRRGDVCRAA